MAERVVVASGAGKRKEQKNALVKQKNVVFLSVPQCFGAVWFGFNLGLDGAS